MKVKAIKWVVAGLSLAVVAGFSLAGVFFLLPADSEAAISGACYNCHSMHASQDGVVQAGGANDILLVGGCGGCHFGGSPNSNAGAGADAGTPHVDDSGTPLSGGYFEANQTGVADTSLHNVVSIDGTDANMAGNLPGNATVAYVAEKLTCLGFDNAGSLISCHTAGGHHTNQAGTLAAGSGNANDSYRFLVGIGGTEDDDWQLATATTNAANDHNFYSGANNSFASGTTATGTISALCGTCHGIFHARAAGAAGIEGSATWSRHPTDFALPTTGEYGTYDPVASYDVATPIGWTGFTPGSLSTPVVICLSCHYAHGGPYRDLLRFSYTTIVAGGAGTTGCLKCHSGKR